MSKGLGALVFIAGVAGLGYWGVKSHAVTMENKIAEGVAPIVAETVHPLTAEVHGRDIVLSGTADTQAELDAIVAALDAVDGRRVVDAVGVEVLPVVDPYETTLAKAADGSVMALGYAPNRVAAEAVTETAALPLGHGAPEGWQEAMAHAVAALAELNEGSFTLTGTATTLSGVAQTPEAKRAASKAVKSVEGFDAAVAIDVVDPGIIAFTTAYNAGSGFTAKGVVPEAVGAKGVADALKLSETPKLDVTAAKLDGVAEALAALRANADQLDAFKVTGDNQGLTISASVLPGLDTDTVAAALRKAVGSKVRLKVVAAATPTEGATRVNALTGRTQVAAGGIWITPPTFEPTREACTEAAMEMASATPIRFVTGSAALDPVSLATINRLTGIIHLCTRDPGMRVVIGGHTDAQGDDAANYVLSHARAKAVRDALIERGIKPSRMTAIGYGETEPIADNETKEGRAMNRRTTFVWPH